MSFGGRFDRSAVQCCCQVDAAGASPDGQERELSTDYRRHVHSVHPSESFVSRVEGDLFACPTPAGVEVAADVGDD